MRLGILVPTRGAVMQSARRPPVEECWAMARHADRAGYDAVWVGDSIVAKPRLEPLTTLAYLAGITARVRLGTAVLLPALRHPVVLAHQIGNVDQISRGRLVRERGEAALARHGRARPNFPLCVYTTVRMDDDARTAERITTEFLATYYGGGVHSRGTMGLGPADVVTAALERYAAAGVSDLCIRFVGDDQLAQLERFTAEVLPALRD